MESGGETSRGVLALPRRSMHRVCAKNSDAAQSVLFVREPAPYGDAHSMEAGNGRPRGKVNQDSEYSVLLDDSCSALRISRHIRLSCKLQRACGILEKVGPSLQASAVARTRAT